MDVCINVNTNTHINKHTHITFTLYMHTHMHTYTHAYIRYLSLEPLVVVKWITHAYHSLTTGRIIQKPAAQLKFLYACIYVSKYACLCVCVCVSVYVCGRIMQSISSS